MPNRPKISILTLAYNHERFIAQAIESVLRQAYENWEMLIMDDESEDHTWEIAQEFARRDARIKPFRSTHQGVWHMAEIYNQALEHSDGDLIAILDGDDFWPDDKLSIQVPEHLRLGVGVTFGQMQFATVDGQPRKEQMVAKGGRILSEMTPRELVMAKLEGWYSIPSVSVLINRASLMKVGGFIQPSYLPLVDYPTWITVGINDGFGYINRVLGYWRQHATQTTWQLSRDCATGIIRFSREFILDHRGEVGDTWAQSLEYSQSNRLDYLVDAIYRQAITAASVGRHQDAAQAVVELMNLDAKTYWRAKAVLSWKSIKRMWG